MFRYHGHLDKIINNHESYIKQIICNFLLKTQQAIIFNIMVKLSIQITHLKETMTWLGSLLAFCKVQVQYFNSLGSLLAFCKFQIQYFNSLCSLLAFCKVQVQYFNSLGSLLAFSKVQVQYFNLIGFNSCILQSSSTIIQFIILHDLLRLQMDDINPFGWCLNIQKYYEISLVTMIHFILRNWIITSC